MSARSGSLAWTVLAGGISIVIAGGLWGIFDTVFVDEITAMQVWQAAQGSVAAQSRAYVVATWNWFLLLPVLRVGIEGIVASRLRGATTNIPAATLVLFIAHLMVVLLSAVFPEMAGAVYDQATNSPTSGGYMTGVNLAWEWGIGLLPAVMLLLGDVWYLSAPIRNDLLRA